MLFNSLHFLVFFPIVCAIYFVLRGLRSRNLFLLAASYYFYMNWEPAYALLLFTSTAVTYVAALGIGRSGTQRRKKMWLAGSLVINLGILFLFKYYNFAAQNLTALMQDLGVAMTMPRFTLLLPVGISFYTFQALGYSIDVYRGKTAVEHDFFTYALFVSFFPQLVAGPIERSTHLLGQFKRKHDYSYERLMDGLGLMLWGYFLKLAVADRCGIYVDAVFNNLSHHNGGSYLLASLLFPFQIYGDFAGYSLTAIGAAKVMGFDLMENFHRPYFSTTVTEFWHRWHISLSTWFKDYVYIPLGGNRVSRGRNYLNVMITFIVSGVWHGANWTFVIWGTLHGALQCIEKALGWNKAVWGRVATFFHWALTFALVSLAWVFFRANSLADAFTVITVIFLRPGFPFLSKAHLLAAAMALFLMFVKETIDERNIGFSLSRSPHWLVRHLYFAAMMAYLMLFGVLGGDQFIYFQF